MKEKNMIIDYDALWKEFITEFLEESVAALNPELHADVDWTVAPQYMEQELFNILKGKHKTKNKRKYTDKLVKLKLKSGEDHCILFHCEAQQKPEEHFSHRMFIYRSLVNLRYEIEDITALAIFTGNPPSKDSFEYRRETYGTVISYRFNGYVIAEQNPEVLSASNNPLHIAALAAYYAHHAKKDAMQRFTFKRQLFYLIQKKKIPREKMVKLLIFVREFIDLPKDLENEFEAKDFSKILTELPMYQYSEGTMRFVDKLFQHLRGMSFDEAKVKIDEAMVIIKEAKKKQKETANFEKKMLAEKQKAEVEKQKAEVEMQKIETEKQKIEAELVRVGIERKSSILNFYQKAHISAEVIAEMMGLELGDVQNVIEEAEKKK